MQLTMKESNVEIYINWEKNGATVKFSDEELIAASRYGVLRASHKFDKSRGFTFAAYAVWWMRQAILQEIRKKGNN